MQRILSFFSSFRDLESFKFFILQTADDAKTKEKELEASVGRIPLSELFKRTSDEAAATLIF